MGAEAAGTVAQPYLCMGSGQAANVYFETHIALEG